MSGRGKKRAETDGKKSRGRPTLFKKEHLRQAFQLKVLGATDEKIAEIWGISVQTLGLWKSKHPELVAEFTRGKDAANSDVAVSMYKRACGYTHKAVKIFYNPKTGDVVKVPYMEHYPPDPVSGKFFLVNREPVLWKDRVDVKHDVSDGLAARLAAARKRVSKKGGGPSK